MTGGETDRLNLLWNLSAFSLHPACPHPHPPFSLQIPNLKWKKRQGAFPILQGQSFRWAAFGVHPDFDGFPLRQLSPANNLTASVRWRREQQIDRWHFTSAGGSTKSRVSPKSSWEAPSFRPQGPPRKPPLLFRQNKRGKRGEGFRERLSHREFWLLLFLLQRGWKSQVFFPSTSNWHQLHPSLYVHLSVFLTVSFSSSLFELWVCLLYN